MTPKADLPAVNWLLHVLTTAEFPGTDIILNESHGTAADKELTIRCDSEYTKSILLEMARRYKENEQEFHRLYSEERSERWHSGNEPPDNSPFSSIRARPVLVTSPALRYIAYNGVAMGYHDLGWHVILNGKAIRHNVTHWRHLPPTAIDKDDYEKVKNEVERLKREAGIR